jgi:uncharacterized protein YprB with RNaseH-like and TPR domain
MLEKKLMVSIPKGTLIDLETTGLNYSNDEILTAGVISGNTLRILQRKHKTKDTFNEDVRKLISSLPQPFFAFNSGFEEGFIRNQLGLKNIKFVDLHAPWRKKAESMGKKWPKLDELITHPEQYFQEKAITGKDVPELWNKFNKTGNENHLDEIIRHNQIDLLREMMLLIHYGND